MVSTSRNKDLNKKQYFLFWTAKFIYTNQDEDNANLRQWKKVVSASQKVSFH